MVKKCVFIDRDGVLNRSNVINGKPYAPNNISNFIFLPRVNKAINILKKKKIFNYYNNQSTRYIKW